MQAGSLRNKVLLEQPVESLGPLGGGVSAWVPFAEAWASVVPISSRERLGAGERGAEITHRVALRYLDGLTAAMRIRLEDGRVLAIDGSPIDVGGLRREMQLLCREMTA